ncbi:MAG: hypothetical protein K0U59_00610 [Gammaproteobacteria bacterium]|nr:hypothetical protein [Gammaproteobacteria bacterium]
MWLFLAWRTLRKNHAPYGRKFATIGTITYTDEYDIYGPLIRRGHARYPVFHSSNEHGEEFC